METKWFTQDSYFELLTKIIRGSDGGSVVYQSELTEAEIGIAEEGVEDDILRVSKPYACPVCDEIYSVSRLPNQCDCGHTFPPRTDTDPDKVKYYTYSFPDYFIEHIGREIGDLEIIYEFYKIEDIPAKDLHPRHEYSQWFLRISPYYEAGMGVYPFPNYGDIFLSWDRVPELVHSGDRLTEHIASVIESIGTEGGSEGNFTNSPIGRIETDSASRYRDAPWYTMRRDHGKEYSDQRSRKEYDCDYHDLFERLGLECLRMLFPYSKITETERGSREPDGYLRSFLPKKNYTYLVEAKCYSKDFKLFDESDKHKRYIDNFIDDVVPRTGTQLKGCIFLANKFNDGRLPKDIDDFVSRTNQNIDIICLNDLMMARIVSFLQEQYIESPSSVVRIYDHTSWYNDLFDILRKYTDNNQTSLDNFDDEVIDVLRAAANKKTDEEKTIKSNMNRDVGRNGIRERLELAP